ncbi:MAG: hypothetical protein RPR97_05845 [Colwellia sp.]
MKKESVMQKSRNIIILVAACSSLAVSNHTQAIEYEFVKKDTLWDLSTNYLKNPYNWPQIKNLDGSAVEDVYRIPIGHVVRIPDSIVKPEILALEQYAVNAGDIIDLNKTTDKSVVKNPYHYIVLYKDSGLVRAFINDKHVIVPIRLLIEKIKAANPGIEIKPFGNGIAISKDLVEFFLNIKK